MENDFCKCENPSGSYTEDGEWGYWLRVVIVIRE